MLLETPIVSTAPGQEGKVNILTGTGPLDDAIRRGEEWLDSNKQNFISETEVGISFKDNFADLLILELSKRWYVSSYRCKLSTGYSQGISRDYVDLRIPDGRWNYFAGTSIGC